MTALTIGVTTVGATACGAFSDDHAGLDAANAACASMTSHHYLAAATSINDAVTADGRWVDMAWAIRAIAWDWNSIGPNSPYPSREDAPRVVQRACSDAAREAGRPPFAWSP
jgi:hypothetical protein